MPVIREGFTWLYSRSKTNWPIALGAVLVLLSALEKQFLLDPAIDRRTTLISAIQNGAAQKISFQSIAYDVAKESGQVIPRMSFPGNKGEIKGALDPKLYLANLQLRMTKSLVSLLPREDKNLKRTQADVESLLKSAKERLQWYESSTYTASSSGMTEQTYFNNMAFDLNDIVKRTIHFEADADKVANEQAENQEKKFGYAQTLQNLLFYAGWLFAFCNKLRGKDVDSPDND